MRLQCRIGCKSKSPVCSADRRILSLSGRWLPPVVVCTVITLLSPLSYFLFTTHDSAIEEISETALIQPSLELARAQSLLCSLDSRCAHHRRAARTPRVDRESMLTSK